MIDYAFPPPTPPSAAIAASEARFPLRRIFCVGRNYAEHAREMGRDPDREPPFFFTKPTCGVVDAGETVPYPPETEDLHFEAELVAAIGSGGAEIPAERALDHVWGYAIGNDLTRRDLQATAKKLGRPWDLAKGFDRCAVCGPIHKVGDVGHLSTGAISLSLNGEPRQKGDLSDMIWPLPEIIAILSRSIILAAGDLVYTGTPAGVGAMRPGDLCTIEIAGLGRIETPIGPRAG